jgi:hypothetical protein
MGLLSEDNSTPLRNFPNLWMGHTPREIKEGNQEYDTDRLL